MSKWDKEVKGVIAMDLVGKANDDERFNPNPAEEVFEEWKKHMKKRLDDSGAIQLIVWIPRSMRDELKVKAAKDKISVSKILRVLIQEHLDK